MRAAIGFQSELSTVGDVTKILKHVSPMAAFVKQKIETCCMDRSKRALYIVLVLVLVRARLESWNGGTSQMTQKSTASFWEPMWLHRSMIQLL